MKCLEVVFYVRVSSEGSQQYLISSLDSLHLLDSYHGLMPKIGE